LEVNVIYKENFISTIKEREINKCRGKQIHCNPAISSANAFSDIQEII